MQQKISRFVHRRLQSLLQTLITQENQELATHLQTLRQQQQPYQDEPRLSIIVQFFNKRANIARLAEHIRQSGAEELIVIDDGSIDGSWEDWLRVLDRPNDFLLRCNDLFEVRTYDRAIRMARGEFVCLLQDDDLPPANPLWVEQAMRLFHAFPKLIILGGRDGLNLLPAITSEFEPSKVVAQPPPLPYHPIQPVGCYHAHLYWQPYYQEPQSQLPFMFTMVVNRAPTFLRRREFLALGGIDQRYAPFQFDDDEACIRAWLAGYQVGLYSPGFLRNLDVGGMALFNRERIQKQALVNGQRLYEQYGASIDNGTLQQLVNQANQLLQQIDQQK